MCCAPGAKPDLGPRITVSATRSPLMTSSAATLIKTEFFLDEDDFKEFNQGKTWGWIGCEKLMAKQRICSSEGTPPAPAQDANSVCGLTVVGTVSTKKSTYFPELDQCPLNACCNTWGQCGIITDVCAPSPLRFSAPFGAQHANHGSSAKT